MGCALVCGVACAATTHTNKRPAIASAWEQAQRQRAALEERAAGTRTRAAYERVLDGFRAIYHDNPRDAHAAEAVYSVAELLAEEGRELDDERCLRSAIGQYEFLRKAYPGSPLRAAALVAEGRIEGDDLGDEAAAKTKLQQLVKESPRSAAAKDARAGLAELAEAKVAAPAVVVPTHHEETVMNGAPKTVAAPVAAPAPVAARSRPLASVTGIRHWSTPTYTRVAIDLGEEVTFEAARVPNPDRIYFDLHGAKLGAELVGKSFDVTDDGFLKRIRAAQAGGDVTRVVLDVNDVTEYSAFLLPNPYRLIIDIHGAKEQGSNQGSGIRDQTGIRGCGRYAGFGGGGDGRECGGEPVGSACDGSYELDTGECERCGASDDGGEAGAECGGDEGSRDRRCGGERCAGQGGGDERADVQADCGGGSFGLGSGRSGGDDGESCGGEEGQG